MKSLEHRATTCPALSIAACVMMFSVTARAAVYITTQSGDRSKIERFSNAGAHEESFGEGIGSPYNSVAVNGGTIYVGSWLEGVKEFSHNGTFLGYLATKNQLQQLGFAVKVETDSEGSIYAWGSGLLLKT